MKPPRGHVPVRYCWMPVLALLAAALSACPSPPPEEAPQQEEPPRSASLPLAVVRAGVDPFWFELAPGGPRLLPSPEHATLLPFLPWKRSRYISGFLAGNDSLIAGINREGFLVFENRDGAETALYYHADPGWDNYTVSSLFWYGSEVPSVMLVRDEIFSSESVPLPDPPVRGLVSGEVKKMEIPALAGFLPQDGWQSDDLILGNDGFWYFREIKPGARADFYRTVDLSRKGELSSEQSYLAAALPAAPTTAPALLAAALEEAGRLVSGPCLAMVISPEFGSRRSFEIRSVSPDRLENLSELAGFYREDMALILFPGGQGVFRDNSGGWGHFALPALPENFVYTAVGMAGSVVIAAWEEQKEWNVGAAGFLMLKLQL